MRKAQSLGIDAFGLNIAFSDANTLPDLAMAFEAAESLSFRTIKLYLNFDYATGGAWNSSSVISLINRYKRSPTYFHYKSRPLVSTFEGPSSANDWPGIKNATRCFFMPDWSSIGAAAAATAANSVVDGLASWDGWPDGPNNITEGGDDYYQSQLDGKPYMMPVSPMFYTNIPNYNKNWLWHSDSLWHTRWLQTLNVRPTFVQIISWNDYGESHYIGPIRPSGIVPGAEWYADPTSHPHYAFTTFLPQYIAAYKLGSNLPLQLPPLTLKDEIVYWYKSNPTWSGSANGTTGNNPAYQTPYPPAALSTDRIFFTVRLLAPATIRFEISDPYFHPHSNQHEIQEVHADSPGITQFSLPLTPSLSTPPDGFNSSSFNSSSSSTYTNSTIKPGTKLGTPQFAIMRFGFPSLKVKAETAISIPEDGRVNWNHVVETG